MCNLLTLNCRKFHFCNYLETSIKNNENKASKITLEDRVKGSEKDTFDVLENKVSIEGKKCSHTSDIHHLATIGEEETQFFFDLEKSQGKI